MLVFHIDLKRAMPTAAFLAAEAGRLAAHGFDTVLLEVEDKHRYARHPDLAHPAAPTRAESRACAAALRSQGLRVIPLIQTLGHAESVLAHPAYVPLRAAPDVHDCFDPCSEAVRALLCELIDELIDVYQPDGYLHVGGDETWGLSRSVRGQEIIQARGLGALYLQHMLPIFRHVQSRGLRPIIWGDILLQHPDLLREVPRDVVIADWDYWTDVPRPRRIALWGHGHVDWSGYAAAACPARELADVHAVDEQTRADGTFRPFFYTDALIAQGFDVLLCSASRCSGDSAALPRYPLHLGNVIQAARKAATTAGCLGHVVTSWAVRHNHPACLWPMNVAAAATRGAADFSPADAWHAWAATCLGGEAPGLGDALAAVSGAVPFSEAGRIEQALAALANGSDPAAALHSKTPNLPEVLSRTRAIRAACDPALAQLRALHSQRPAAAHVLDFLIEGVDLTAFYADFAVAALEGRLPAEAAALQARLNALRDRTAALFATTYHPLSVTAELAVRYGLHDAWLKHASLR